MAVLRQRPGKQGWWLEWRHPVTGRRERKMLSRDKRVAERIYREKVREADMIRAGLAPAVGNDAVIADLWRDFHASLVGDGLAPETIKQPCKYVPTFFEAIGATKVSDVTLDKADTYKTDRGRIGRSARTINVALMWSRRMLAWAVDHGRIGTNPLDRVKMVKAQPVHERRALTVDECGRLLACSPPWYRGLWTLYLCTGMRRSEGVYLTWGNIDLERRTIHLEARATKTRKERLVFFGPKVAATLRDTGPGEADSYVFKTTRGTPHKNNLLTRFRTCCKAAGIDLRGVDLHALRATFATLVMETGTDLKTAQTLIGHGAASGVLLLDKYAKPRMLRLHEAAARVEDMVFAAEAKAQAEIEATAEGTHEAPAERRILQVAVG